MQRAVWGVHDATPQPNVLSTGYSTPKRVPVSGFVSGLFTFRCASLTSRKNLSWRRRRPAAIRKRALRRGISPGIVVAFLAGIAWSGFVSKTAAQPITLPKLSVSAAHDHILEGQSTTITFRLSTPAIRLMPFDYEVTVYGDAVDWDFSTTEPEEGVTVRLSASFDTNEQETSIALVTEADGGVDDGSQSFKVKVVNSSSLAPDYVTDTDNDEITVDILDDYDYYNSLILSVASESSSIYEGNEAEFTISRTGGLTNSSGDTLLTADEVPVTVNFIILETGYVFSTGVADWSLKSPVSFQPLGINPAETASVTLAAGVSGLTVQVATDNDSVRMQPITRSVWKLSPGRAHPIRLTRRARQRLSP